MSPREGYVTEGTESIKLPASALLEVAREVAALVDPGGQGGGPVSLALQSVVQAAASEGVTDGELVDAFAHAVAGCLAQTIAPDAAYGHFVTMTAELTGRLTEILRPKGEA